MAAIPAVYENGVFRPTGPVDLPEGAVVDIELGRPSDLSHIRPTGSMKAIYAILSERFDGGQHDMAERHNEHQP